MERNCETEGLLEESKNICLVERQLRKEWVRARVYTRECICGVLCKINYEDTYLPTYLENYTFVCVKLRFMRRTKYEKGVKERKKEREGLAQTIM